jgi:putative addiction module component (TIGR02574 family)
MTRGGGEPRRSALAQIFPRASFDLQEGLACQCLHQLYPEWMTPAVSQILQEAERLSAPDRAELTDRLVESLGHDIPRAIAEAQLAEVRRRIAQVETGEVALVPGEEALAQVRSLVNSWRAES